MPEFGSHIWRTGPLRWQDIRRLQTIEELLSRALRVEFDPQSFERVQTNESTFVRMSEAGVCCCPFDPVKVILDEDLDDSGASYTIKVNDQTEAYVFEITGTDLLPVLLPEMSDLPRPPQECFQLHLINLSSQTL